MKDSGALGYALLGLLSGHPRSGYELRKIFASTPMGHYSDSPGSIYPALRRLREKRLIGIVRERHSNPRGRRRFAPTAKGRDALLRWITEPIDRESVTSKMAEIALRFSMTDFVGDRDAVRKLFAQFEEQLASYVIRLREIHATLGGPSSGRLALELGIRLHETYLQWARDALAQTNSHKEIA